MQIVGLTNNSFIDYPGHIAMVLFVAGCNMNCYYCHNRDIIGNSKSNIIYAPDLIIKGLEEKKDFLDGVVITGGEPTIHANLPDFIRKLKRPVPEPKAVKFLAQFTNNLCRSSIEGVSLLNRRSLLLANLAQKFPRFGFWDRSKEKTSMLVKLDTNGTNPKMLEDLMQENLIDFVAMDIKAPKEKYNEICGAKIDISDIEKSINIIKNSGIDYEFRTTFAPSLDEKDIIKIVKWISKNGPVKKYVLQQYRIPDVKLIDNRLSLQPHSKEYLLEMLQKVKLIIPNTIIRGV